MSDAQPDLIPGRPEPRRFAATLIITSAVAVAMGVTLRQPALMSANDISRWCTVWSLLERGSYVIDDCPWQIETQDKIQYPPPPRESSPTSEPTPSPETVLPKTDSQPAEAVARSAEAESAAENKTELAQAGAADADTEANSATKTEAETRAGTQPPNKTQTAAAPSSDPNAPGPGRHYYSSKPALLSTVIAGLLYPARKLSGVPLDRVVLQQREPRYGQKRDETGKIIGVLETPEPVKWPSYGYYFKPALIAINILPFGLFLILFARVLDRYATNDWAWFCGLASAAWGTYLLPFSQTLNNHTVAAFAAFFALYQFSRIWDEWEHSGWRFAGAGFFAAFAAATELPAASFLAVIGALLLVRFPKKTLLCFVPAAAIPVAGFVAAQYAAFGEFELPYTEFGNTAYEYDGSLWKTPLELDALNKPELRESYGMYLFHLTLGHHGIFSLTPVFLFSLLGLLRLLRGGGTFLTVWTWLTFLAIAGLGGYYLYDPAAWAAGGPLHEYRLVFWAIPGLLALLALLSGLILLRGGGQPMAAVAWMTAILTVVVVGFYTWSPQARNYGGSTQGLRWVFWLIPFWLFVLPRGLEGGQVRRFSRRLAVLALAISALSVGYAMRNPWSHPWILDLIERMGLYPMLR
jgi:hypothetical protein